MKVQILANYINSIEKELKPSEKKCFIVLCTLDADDDNLQDEWLGTLNTIKASISKSEKRMMKEIQNKFNQMSEIVQNDNFELSN